MEIIDLSQEIYAGMPVFHSLPAVKISVHATHEQWAGLDAAETATPSVLKLDMSEHTGTHVDAISHMGRPYATQSIDAMPLTMFYTSAFCLDFSHKTPGAFISAHEIDLACRNAGEALRENDTVLICTRHYERYFNTPLWPNGPGLTAEATRFLGEHKIAAFGVETMSPGTPKVSNRAVHEICGELGFTHYENLVNLHLLVGRGRFRFIAFPLKIRGGTGSPVRAVAVFE
ncbi:MAG: cyclase family protein [Saprospiraceae bacterium]|nr:cyclase family protein [Saprospiraceae bacterium]